MCKAKSTLFAMDLLNRLLSISPNGIRRRRRSPSQTRPHKNQQNLRPDLYIARICLLSHADQDFVRLFKSIKPTSNAGFAPVASTSKQPSPPVLVSQGLEYADLSDAKVPKCLLCQRQFKSVDILQRHSSQSDLHKVSLHTQLFLQLLTRCLDQPK